ncbi:MAG: hypothetical protein V4598_07965 [Bdellovibrionota bacterium]
MMDEELRKLKHDLKRPFSNLEMLLTILKGSEMEKSRLIENLEKIIHDGQEALKRLDQ